MHREDTQADQPLQIFLYKLDRFIVPNLTRYVYRFSHVEEGHQRWQVGQQLVRLVVALFVKSLLTTTHGNAGQQAKKTAHEKAPVRGRREGIGGGEI